MLTQTIHPQGFIATRFGFDSAMSTQVEHWLAQCAQPALRSAVETVFHAQTQADRQQAVETVRQVSGGDKLPQFIEDAMALATAAETTRAAVFTL